MPSQIRKYRSLPEQLRRTRQPESTSLDGGISLGVSSQDALGRRPGPPDHRPVHQPVTVKTVKARVEPEEVLIADARGILTPSQMVERKLMALLRDVGPGVSLKRTDWPRRFQRGRKRTVLQFAGR
jgi:hypothetical protein